MVFQDQSIQLFEVSGLTIACGPPRHAAKAHEITLVTGTLTPSSSESCGIEHHPPDRSSVELPKGARSLLYHGVQGGVSSTRLDALYWKQMQSFRRFRSNAVPSPEMALH